MLDEPLVVNRDAALRDTADVDAARAVIVRDGRVWGEDGSVVLLSPDERPDAEVVIYLGRLDGEDLVAVVPSDPTWGQVDEAAGPHVLAAGAPRMEGLRDMLAIAAARGRDGAADRELAVTSVALAAWHASHQRCAACGQPTEVRKGGWVRWCEPCAKEHYPRTDPAVIVAITDAEDRILLAHASYWSPRRFSHLAGYVEPGESLEQAVHREVWEEARLTLHDVRYVASQPWPFPASVMVGFTARVDDTTLQLDQDEITEAMFVSREELPRLIEAGTVILPPSGSIAGRMMEDWFGGEIR